MLLLFSEYEEKLAPYPSSQNDKGVRPLDRLLHKLRGGGVLFLPAFSRSQDEFDNKFASRLKRRKVQGAAVFRGSL